MICLVSLRNPDTRDGVEDLAARVWQESHWLSQRHVAAAREIRTRQLFVNDFAVFAVGEGFERVELDVVADHAT